MAGAASSGGWRGVGSGMAACQAQDMEELETRHERANSHALWRYTICELFTMFGAECAMHRGQGPTLSRGPQLVPGLFWHGALETTLRGGSRLAH